MRRIAFVAPFLRGSTQRFLQGFYGLADTDLCVITMEPVDSIPPSVRGRLTDVVRVMDAGDPRQLAEAVQTMTRRTGPVDALVGFLEQLQLPIAEARELVGLPGMRADVARGFRDKDVMKARLRKVGLPVAKSRLVGNVEEALAFAKEVGFPVVCKPPAGAGAKSTWRVNDANEMAAVFAAMRVAEGTGVQCEEFVVGREQTAESAMVDGKVVWRSGTAYVPSPLMVLENPWMQYCVLLPRETDDPEFTTFHPTSDAALEALGMVTGFAHMEWFRTADGRGVISEVGCRPPGANIMPLMGLAHGCDMYARWAELVAWDRFSPPVRSAAAGTVFFRGKGKGRVVAVHGLAQAQEEVGRYVVDASLPTPGQPAADGYEGEGYAIVKAPTTREASHALARLVRLIQVELG